MVFGYASPDEPDLSSEGNDDEPIEATVEELILSSDDLATRDWSETDPKTDRPCRRPLSPLRGRPDRSLAGPLCVGTRGNAVTGEEYETRLGRSQKLVGRIVDGVDVGVEAAVIRDGLEMEIVFRDANAVRRVIREMVAAESMPEE